jgi:hypothetical protein
MAIKMGNLKIIFSYLVTRFVTLYMLKIRETLARLGFLLSNFLLIFENSWGYAVM